MLGWLGKCRVILVRYAKKSSNYMGIIQLACAVPWYRRQHRLAFEIVSYRHWSSQAGR